MVIKIDCEVSRALFMYIPAFQGFGVVVLLVLYLLSENETPAVLCHLFGRYLANVL